MLSWRRFQQDEGWVTIEISAKATTADQGLSGRPDRSQQEGCPEPRRLFSEGMNHVGRAVSRLTGETSFLPTAGLITGRWQCCCIRWAGSRRSHQANQDRRTSSDRTAKDPEQLALIRSELAVFDAACIDRGNP